jgi:hypothetical protein
VARYLLKASDEDFDRWRSAAESSEAPSLAAWIRGALNAAADGSVLAAALERPAVREALAPVVAQLALDPGRSFRPDFRPLSSKRGRR